MRGTQLTDSNHPPVITGDEALLESALEDVVRLATTALFDLRNGDLPAYCTSALVPRSSAAASLVAGICMSKLNKEESATG